MKIIKRHEKYVLTIRQLKGMRIGKTLAIVAALALGLVGLSAFAAQSADALGAN
jgi:hypothetical protein